MNIVETIINLGIGIITSIWLIYTLSSKIKQMPTNDINIFTIGAFAMGTIIFWSLVLTCLIAFYVGKLIIRLIKLI